jgi:hypothetical protein
METRAWRRSRIDGARCRSGSRLVAIHVQRCGFPAARVFEPWILGARSAWQTISRNLIAPRLPASTTTLSPSGKRCRRSPAHSSSMQSAAARVNLIRRGSPPLCNRFAIRSHAPHKTIRPMPRCCFTCRPLANLILDVREADPSAIHVVRRMCAAPSRRSLEDLLLARPCSTRSSRRPLTRLPALPAVAH